MCIRDSFHSSIDDGLTNLGGRTNDQHIIVGQFLLQVFGLIELLYNFITLGAQIGSSRFVHPIGSEYTDHNCILLFHRGGWSKWRTQNIRHLLSAYCFLFGCPMA